MGRPLADANGDQVNGVNGTMNGTTARSTSRQGRRGASGWGLDELVRPLPVRRRPTARTPRLLRHYPAVVEWIYLNRYATSGQIRRQFPTYLRSERTAHYQLAGLVRAGYLAITPVRSTAPNFPFVFSVIQRGIRLIRETYASLGVRWSGAATEHRQRSGIALDSILHELALTEFGMAIDATVQHRPDIECLLAERRYFRRDRRLTFPHEGRTRSVVPDAGYLFRVATAPTGEPPKASLLFCAVEFDNGTLSRARLAEKLRHYTQWADSTAGQRYLAAMFQRYGGGSQSPNFRLLVIVRASRHPGCDTDRLLDFFALALDLPAAMRDRIWLAGSDDLRRHEHDPAPLVPPLWLRPRDGRPWLVDYRAHLAAAEHSAKQTATLRARRFIKRELADLPRHSLFPYLPKGIKVPAGIDE